MSFFRNIYKVATSVCRKEKSLNQKRANPYADLPQPRNIDLEEDINNDGESLTLISPKQKINSQENDTRIEEETNKISHQSTMRLDNQEEQVQNGVKSSAKNNDLLLNSSNEEQIDVGDIETNSSSGDSEEGEQGPYKKRKMDVFVCSKEEEKITQGWKTDLSSIKKSIGRMNRLFEIYEGYKKKRDPLTISPDKMLEEPALDEQTSPCEEVIEEFPNENLANIANQPVEAFDSFDKQYKNCAEFYKASPIKSRRQSCAQDLLANMPTLPDTAGVGI